MPKKMVSGVFLVMALWAAPSMGQSLFESALPATLEPTAAGLGAAMGFELGGYIKGALFCGPDGNDEADIKGAYGQRALKIGAAKQGFGKAFAEVRYDGGLFYEEQRSELDLREAWVEISPGPLDFSLGKQIIVWGRGDGINPTNNLTPRNQFALSSELDGRSRAPGRSCSAPSRPAGWQEWNPPRPLP